MRLLAPPALTNGRVFLSTTLDDVVRLDATGTILWSVNVGEPIVFQPTVMKGRAFVGTSGGHVASIETVDAKDDGWPMWGGSPAHNGPKRSGFQQQRRHAQRRQFQRERGPVGGREIRLRHGL
jgi:hypothetical protein